MVNNRRSAPQPPAPASKRGSSETREHTPGATKTWWTWGDNERRHARACSLPPEQTTSTLDLVLAHIILGILGTEGVAGSAACRIHGVHLHVRAQPCVHR